MSIVDIIGSELFSLGGLLTSQLAIGGIIGFLMGFAIKKITKIAIFILGIFLLILVYLEYNNFISINYEKISETLKDVMKFDNSQGISIPFLQSFFFNIPSMIGFGAGFVIGLKKG